MTSFQRTVGEDYKFTKKLVVCYIFIEFHNQILTSLYQLVINMCVCVNAFYRVIENALTIFSLYLLSSFLQNEKIRSQPWLRIIKIVWLNILQFSIWWIWKIDMMIRIDIWIFHMIDQYVWHISRNVWWIVKIEIIQS